MKTCCRCGESKLESEFHKNSQQTSGLHPCCKSCRKTEQQESYLKNRDKRLASGAKWREENHARQLELQKRHYERNKPLYTAKVAKRKAQQLAATPAWLSKKDKSRIEKEYEIAALLSEATGYSWHVDHIVPLQGHNVCGLHVPDNLRAVPWFENLSKGNSH